MTIILRSQNVSVTSQNEINETFCPIFLQDLTLYLSTEFYKEG